MAETEWALTLEAVPRAVGDELVRATREVMELKAELKSEQEAEGQRACLATAAQ